MLSFFNTYISRPFSPKVDKLLITSKHLDMVSVIRRCSYVEYEGKYVRYIRQLYMNFRTHHLHDLHLEILLVLKMVPLPILLTIVSVSMPQKTWFLLELVTLIMMHFVKLLQSSKWP